METKPITNPLLKEKMVDAMVDRGYCANLDTLLTQGVYYTNAATVCANPPTAVGIYWRYAIVEVILRISDVYQRVTCQGGCVIRYITADGTIGDWITLGAL